MSNERTLPAAEVLLSIAVPPLGLVSGFPFDIATAARIWPGEWCLLREHSPDGFTQITAMRSLIPAWSRVVELSGVEQVAHVIC